LAAEERVEALLAENLALRRTLSRVQGVPPEEVMTCLLQGEVTLAVHGTCPTHPAPCRWSLRTQTRPARQKELVGDWQMNKMVAPLLQM
jgi:hypothetical protein